MDARAQSPPVRRTRGEAREHTRQRLLAAALNVFVEKGFAASSVEDISARAGFSRGALYSNFADKDALFLSLMDARLKERVAGVTRVMTASSPLTVFEDLRQWKAVGDVDDGWTRLTAEFRAHALRNESARLRLAEHEGAVRDAYAQAVEAQFAAVGLAPPAPAADLAALLSILDVSVPMQQLLDPVGVSESFFFDTLALLFRATVALAEATGDHHP